jgi:hypothetical protein
MTRRRHVNLEGCIRLPAPVRLRSGVLGENYWTRIGSFDVRLKLPRVDMGVMCGLTRPNVSRYGARHLQAEESISWPWGSVVLSTTKQADVVAVEGLVVGIVLDGHKPKDALQAVLDGYRDWFRRLKDWIEVYSDQDLDPNYTGYGVVEVNQAYFWTIGERPNSLVNPHSIRMTVQDGPGGSLTKREWKRILINVESATQPTDERLLLRDVGIAVARGQYRRAVLDSATLAELSLWELIGRAHAGTLSRLGNATLGKLWRVASGMQISLPAHFPGSGFVRLRNKTAHKTPNVTAYTPTPAEATNAHRTATELLEAAFPLKPL